MARSAARSGGMIVKYARRDPEPPRCGVCDRRHRSNADAFACEKMHDVVRQVALECVVTLRERDA